MQVPRVPARINVKFVVVLGLALLIVGGGLAGGYKVRKRIIADRALAAGKAALERQDWAEACKQLKQYLSRYPDSPDMLARYAEANLAVRPRQAENIGAAIAAYRRYLRARPGEEKASHALARLYLQTRTFEDAAYVSRQRLNVQPDDVTAQLSLSRALVGLGKGDEAKSQWLEPLVKSHPDQVDAFLLLAEVVAQDRSATPDSVQVLLDQAVTNNPQSIKAWLARAGWHQERARQASSAAATQPDSAAGHDESALADLERADALKPADPQLLITAFSLWMDRNRPDRAEAELKAFEALDDAVLAESDIEPEMVKLLKFTAGGRLALKRGDTPAGVALADRARQELTARQRLAFLETAAELYLAADEIAKARECVTELRTGTEATNDPELTDRLAILGAAVVMKDEKANPFEAISALRDVLVVRPQDARAWKLLADGYLRTGQVLRAVDALGERIRLVPGDDKSAVALAQAYLALDARHAAGIAAGAEKVFPDSLELKLIRISAQLQASSLPGYEVDHVQLRRELDDLRAAHPKSAEVSQLWARSALAQGDKDSAIRELRKAVAECDDKVAAAVALSAMAQEQGRDDEALEAAENAIKQARSSAQARIRLAMVQEHRKDTQAARQTLEAAVTELMGEEKLQAQLALVGLLSTHEARREAIDLLSRAAAERPYDSRLRLVLLGLPEISSDAASAQRIIDELRSMEGGKGLLWPVEQAKLWRAGQPTPAQQQQIIELLTRVVEAGGAGPEPVLMLGQVYQARAEIQRAEEVYRRSLDAGAFYVAVVQELLSLLERQGRLAEAAALLKRMPADHVALSPHREYVGLASGDTDAALTELSRRVSGDPQDAASRVTMARVVYAQKRDAKAAFALLDEAEKASPDLPGLLTARVAILDAERRTDEAIALLDREVQRKNNFDTYLARAGYFEYVGRVELAGKDYVHLTSFEQNAARAHEALALFYGRTRRPDESLAACEAGLKKAPDDIALQRLLAVALASRSEPEAGKRGQQMLESLLAKNPNDSGLLIARAEMLMQAGDAAAREAAVATLERVVTVEPVRVRAHLLLIDLARQEGDQALARQRLVRALGTNPASPELLMARAVLEVESNNLAAAREAAEQVVSSNEKHLQALNLLVNVCVRLGEPAAAEQYNARVLGLEPNNETARLARAEIHLAKGQLVEAIAAGEEYARTEAGAKSVSSLLQLGRLYTRAERFDDAQAKIEQAGKMTSASDPQVLLLRLECLLAQKRYRELAELAMHPPNGAPDVPSLQELAATMLAATGQPDCMQQARMLCREALKADSRRTDASFKLGQLAFMANDLVEAEKAYRQVLAINPDHQQALNDLAWVLGTATGKPEEALEYATRGIAKYPSDPHLRDTRAAILIRLNRLDEARADLEQCLKLTEAIPLTRVNALRRLARVLDQQGLPDQARQRYAEALEIDQTHHVLTEADQAELRRIMGAAANQ